MLFFFGGGKSCKRWFCALFFRQEGSGGGKPCFPNLGGFRRGKLWPFFPNLGGFRRGKPWPFFWLFKANLDTLVLRTFLPAGGLRRGKALFSKSWRVPEGETMAVFSKSWRVPEGETMAIFLAF